MITFVINSSWFIIYLHNPISCSKFTWFILCICLTSLLFFDVSLLYIIIYYHYFIIYYYYILSLSLSYITVIYYHYINLRSLKFCCLCSEDIYLCLIVSSSFVSELFCSETFDNLVILSAILFPIKSPVASTVFWNALFEAV